MRAAGTSTGSRTGREVPDRGERVVLRDAARERQDRAAGHADESRGDASEHDGSEPSSPSRSEHQEIQLRAVGREGVGRLALQVHARVDVVPAPRPGDRGLDVDGPHRRPRVDQVREPPGERDRRAVAFRAVDGDPDPGQRPSPGRPAARRDGHGTGGTPQRLGRHTAQHEPPRGAVV